MVSEPVAVSLDVDDLAVVQQPVQDGGSDDGISEELLPVPETFVGSNDGGVFFVSPGDELEEEIGLLRGHGKIAYFIHDHQRGFQIGLGPGLALLEFFDQGVHGGEIDTDAVVASLGGQGDGQMGLSHSRGTQEDDVFMV